MYILIEGMPCTGKTTVSKRLAEITGSVYLKSVLSESKLGNKLKRLRDKDNKTLEYLYAADSMIEELKTINLIREGYDIIRDKSYVSSIAHIFTHGFENNQEPYKNIVKELYMRLCEESAKPNLVVLIEPDFEGIKENMKKKTDLSSVDLQLIEKPGMYITQHRNLKKLLSHLYNDKLYLVKSFSMPVEEICNNILREYEKRR